MTIPKNTQGCVPVSRESAHLTTFLCTSSFTESGSRAMKRAMPMGLIRTLIPQRPGLASLAKDCSAHDERGAISGFPVVASRPVGAARLGFGLGRGEEGRANG